MPSRGINICLPVGLVQYVTGNNVPIHEEKGKKHHSNQDFERVISIFQRGFQLFAIDVTRCFFLWDQDMQHKAQYVNTKPTKTGGFDRKRFAISFMFSLMMVIQKRADGCLWRQLCVGNKGNFVDTGFSLTVTVIKLVEGKASLSCIDLGEIEAGQSERIIFSRKRYNTSYFKSEIVFNSMKKS